ncbi:mast cell protease 1A-like [Erpetoichthys calabaricus]|uniref:mast cell protease 1A-like n=1 Tax=Erpetoichthys calabaricus TaxID=27687 RepID=UPI0022343877|nr:mast cell protease 1A-like [Erpetoichthys calabaricus]
MDGLRWTAFMVLCLGLAGASEVQIINGHEAKPHSRPYMAYLSIEMEDGSGTCGGFLINPDFILTAAHCNGESITVVLGAHNMSTRETSWQLIQAEKMIPHPDYNSSTLVNDIMLLKALSTLLPSPCFVSLSFPAKLILVMTIDGAGLISCLVFLQLAHKAKLKKQVKLVEIPQADDDVQPGDLCSVAGWGNTVTNGDGSNVLREVNVTIIYWDTCKKSWDAMIPENTICAGGYKTTKGFCQGDSGGPLICNNKAMGIVSFNSILGCKYPNLPNVYTSVAPYRDWINSVLQKHSRSPL